MIANKPPDWLAGWLAMTSGQGYVMMEEGRKEGRRNGR